MITYRSGALDLPLAAGRNHLYAVAKYVA